MTIDKSQVPHSFDRVAARYDLLNALNPGYGKHLSWSAARMVFPEGGRVLDLCCGTGLSTSAVVRSHSRAQVVALDGSEGMLKVARRKPDLAAVEFILGDAGDPAAAGVDGPFDAVFMAYGIRNVADPDTCLGNIRSLMKPGGSLAIHEYSVADSALAKVVWNAVAGTVIIPLGSIATRSPSLFRYLRKSVNDFDGVQAFVERLRRAGFITPHVYPMDGWQRGVVHTFTAVNPG